MKITKVLITGVAGSGGSYLAEYIANNHPEVEIHGLASLGVLASTWKS